MAGKSKYSDEERRRVYIALQVNDGQIKPASRDSGIPIATVRDWKRKWDTEGAPPEVTDAQAISKAVDVFVEDATRVRDKALERLEAVIETADKPRDIATVIGILDDKIRLHKGLATSRTETLSVGIAGTPEQVQALFTNWAQKSVSDAATRVLDIDEVEAEIVDEQPPRDSLLLPAQT